MTPRGGLVDCGLTSMMTLYTYSITSQKKPMQSPSARRRPRGIQETSIPDANATLKEHKANTDRLHQWQIPPSLSSAVHVPQSPTTSR